VSGIQDGTRDCWCLMRSEKATGQKTDVTFSQALMRCAWRRQYLRRINVWMINKAILCDSYSGCFVSVSMQERAVLGDGLGGLGIAGVVVGGPKK